MVTTLLSLLHPGYCTSSGADKQLQIYFITRVKSYVKGYIFKGKICEMFSIIKASSVEWGQ